MPDAMHSASGFERIEVVIESMESGLMGSLHRKSQQSNVAISSQKNSKPFESDPVDLNRMISLAFNIAVMGFILVEGIMAYLRGTLGVANSAGLHCSQKRWLPAM